MNIAQFFIERRVITLVLTVVMLGAGMQAFEGLSRLEDPEFTIKDALVITPYPGASAAEVEQEVSDKLEIAVQKLGQLKRVTSESVRGMSTLTVTIRDNYDKTTLPQVWDEIRRKVNDIQEQLPPGAGPSLVIDDYGDVYGNFIAVYGKGFSYAELKKVTDMLRRELLLVEDVGKIDTFGEYIEAIYVELNPDRMSQMGIPERVIINELRQKNAVSDAGRVKVGREFITIKPTGGVTTVEQFNSIVISRGSDKQIYLRDIARVWRGYVEPQKTILSYDGSLAIGLGISTVSGGNVVKMGNALLKRLHELGEQIPVGIEAGLVSIQSTSVEKSINGFVVSLAEAVVIVIAVLMLFMGLRSAALIGFLLVLTIAGTFIFLAPMGVALERISLGALIIALGMLVDNAIVVVDGVLVRLRKNEEVKHAAIEVVKQTAIPLLGATIIAILAFAAIGTSDDSTGEFCRSLFQVVLVSLLLSWVTAVSVTPLLCVMFLKAPESGKGGAYDSSFYRAYSSFLEMAIRRKAVSLAVVFGLFATAVWGFGFVNQSFFPPSTRAQFMVDIWMPQGTHIDDTATRVSSIENHIIKMNGVSHVTSIVGQGAMRFLLTYTPEKTNSAYAQLFVDVEDAGQMDVLQPELDDYLIKNYPDMLAYSSRFQLGPGSTGKVQARFSGPDRKMLRHLSEQTQEIFHNDPDSKAVRTDWRQRVKVIQPVLAELQANMNGISRHDVSKALLRAYQGQTVGIYREKDLLLPIIMRAAAERSDVKNMHHLQIWSPVAQAMIPLRQVVTDVKTSFEDEIIQRRNRRPTITIYADPVHGLAGSLFARVRPQVEALPLPPGYSLEWGGEYEDSADAQAGLATSIPVFFMAMVLITIMLFNSLKQSLIIWLTVPLALIGVTAGLLGTGQPFGFMALLGFLSLTGMLVKNAIVLIDEINLQLREKKPLQEAIIDSGISRLRPVLMAASTTALGMLPLLFDAFFVSMAVTIIAGLAFATLLTMIIVPVLYATFYRGAAS